MQKRTTIRQTLSTLIVFSSLVAGVVSCKKDKDERQDTPPPPAATKISEYKNGEEFIRFDYNTDGSVKKIILKNEFTTDNNTIEYNVSYNAARKIAEIQSTAGERIVPVYENNILTRADIFEGAERTGYNNYLFENDALKRVTLYWGLGTEFEPYFEFNFTHDNAGNNTETVAMIATGEPGHLKRAGHIVYKHDTKTNPLYIHKDLMNLLWLAPSKNNITQEDHFDSNLAMEDRYTYTYTYKTNGLPERAEVKMGLPGQTPATSQVDFIYK